jgi:hypothetical protein
VADALRWMKLENNNIVGADILGLTTYASRDEAFQGRLFC